MRTWTIRRRIQSSFAAILILMVAMGAAAFAALVAIDRAAEQVQSDSLQGLHLSGVLMNAWSKDYSLVERYALQHNAEDRDLPTLLAASLTALQAAIRDYEATPLDEQDRDNLDAFHSALDAYLDARSGVIARVADSRQRAAALAAVRAQLDPEFDKGTQAIEAIVAYNRTMADRAASTIRRDIVIARNGILAAFVLALGAALVAGYLLMRAIAVPLAEMVTAVGKVGQGDLSGRLPPGRQDEFGTLAAGFNGMLDALSDLVGQVQTSGMQVNTSVNEIAGAAREHQATSTEIAATTTEIGATSKEISATSHELARTAGEVAVMADQSAALAGSAQGGLAQMEQAMRQIMEASSSINARLGVLNEKAGSINQVVTTITKVADQTNLLSLNASIEAEKAGEYGKGFSVVATEIRRLADQTAVATLDIEQTVKEMQSAVAAGVMSMDKFSEEVRSAVQEVQQIGGQLTQVIQQVQALAPRIDAVKDGMNAQATGAEQITQALGQLSEASQQTVESLRQSALAIERLNDVSGTLKSGISRFKLA